MPLVAVFRRRFVCKFGFIAAKFIGSSREGALSEITSMRNKIGQEQQALTQLEASAHRDMDALALQLGGLQAQATRLNALGQRLTEVGKLGDGEFDFSKSPGLGGAEDPGASSHPLDFDLATNIAGLHDQFSQQETQLDIIENLLLDRKLENAMVPAGYPVTNSYVGSTFGSPRSIRSMARSSIISDSISMPSPAATSRSSRAVWSSGRASAPATAT